MFTKLRLRNSHQLFNNTLSEIRVAIKYVWNMNLNSSYIASAFFEQISLNSRNFLNLLYRQLFLPKKASIA